MPQARVRHRVATNPPSRNDVLFGPKISFLLSDICSVDLAVEAIPIRAKVRVDVEIVEQTVIVL